LYVINSNGIVNSTILNNYNQYNPNRGYLNIPIYESYKKEDGSISTI
jgi:hypothetical protein